MRLDAPRRRLIALLLGVAAVVVVLIIVLGGGDESADEAARSSAEEFVSVLTEGDYESACGMLTEALATQLGGDQCGDRLAATVGRAGEDLEIEVLEVRVSGPKAVADTEVRRPEGPPAESSFEMQLSEDTWQVSKLGS